MKKLLFILPFGLCALVFSFCKKDTVPETNVTQTDVVQTGASDRTDCPINVTTTGAVQVCGLPLNQIVCTSCDGLTQAKGTQVVTTSQNFTMGGGITFYLTNVSVVSITVTVTTAVNSVTYTLIPGRCIDLYLDSDCEIISHWAQ